jgi:nucleoside-diphosphate-sugar epimerase
MRIALVGGTGFIGTPTARRLAAAGHEVDAFGRERTRARFAPDVVVCFMLLNEGDACAAVAAWPDARLVAISSGDVYRAYGQLLGREPRDDEPRDDEPRDDAAPLALLDEDAPLRTALYPYRRQADGPWGRLVDYDKILVERVVRAAPQPWTILRLPKVWGAQARDRPFGRWVDWMRSHDELPVGARQGRWRWTHGYVEDVAAAIALAATDARAAGCIYNVGEPETPTQRQRVLDLAAALGWRGRVVDVADPELPPALRDPHDGAPDLAFDTRRIRRALGYAEPTRYADALATLGPLT